MLSDINTFTLIGHFDTNQYNDGSTKYYIIINDQKIPITIAPGVPIEVFGPKDYVVVKGNIMVDNYNVILYVERMVLLVAHRKK
jgi:hypothetical protein